MNDLKQECQFLNRDINQIVSKVAAAENKRRVLLRLAIPEFDTKIAKAKENFKKAKSALSDEEEKARVQRIYVPNAIKKEVQEAKKKFEMCQTIESKLSKAKELCLKISNEDRDRAIKISQLQAQANDLIRLLPRSADEAQLKEAEAKLNALKIQINQLYAQILESEKRIQRYYQLAQSYDESHLEQFAAHWLEVARVIIERDDAYGFSGTIIYRDLGTKQTPNTGLEARSSVSYGTILQEGEVIQYTYPDTSIKIEQDHTGKITDKSVYNHDDERNLAAIKCAKLLLLDCKLRKDPNMYIKGPASELPQTLRVIAALRVLAEEAGIALEDDKGKSLIEVKVPGWGVGEAMKMQIDALKVGIKGISTRAKDGFKDMHEQLKANPDLAEDETVLRQSRSPGGFGVSR